MAGLALAEMEDDPDRRLEMILKAALMPMLSLRKIEGSANFGVLLAREATDPKSAERGIIQEAFDPDCARDDRRAEARPARPQ